MAKKGTLKMSGKERESLLVLERVKKGELSLREAAEILGVSYRQCCRRNARYRQQGAAGLTHRLRGRRGNRAMAAETGERITELYGGEYKGFGPVLFTEKLGSVHGITADHETVRRLLVREGMWRVRRRRKSEHLPWRERRGHFGEMVQMDGSHHRWFEGRGAQCCLMVMIDDATGVRMSLMAEEETTEAAMRLMRKWVRRYGAPRSLYVDKKNVYVPSEKDVDKARLEGRKIFTQFGRVCSKLGVEIIRAHSPQAKGRVERTNGVYQDRLVKELRLRKISDPDAANELIGGGWFDEDLNRRFSVRAAKRADYHRPVPDRDIPGVFCTEEKRTLSRHWTLSYRSTLYRIRRGSADYSPAKRKVRVRQYLDGSLHIFYRGREVEFEKFHPKQAKNNRSVRTGPRSAGTEIRKSPAPDHPWRQSFLPKREIKPFY